MRPPNVFRKRLTGVTRVRRQWFTGRLVLQVEVRHESADAFAILPCPTPPGRDPDAWAKAERDRIARMWKCAGITWSDATAADLLRLSGADLIRLSVTPIKSAVLQPEARP